MMFVLSNVEETGLAEKDWSSSKFAKLRVKHRATIILVKAFLIAVFLLVLVLLSCSKTPKHLAPKWRNSYNSHNNSPFNSIFLFEEEENQEHEEPADECIPSTVTNSAQCNFVKTDKECRDVVKDGLVNYLSFYYCDLTTVRWLAVITMVVLVVYLFLCIGVVAEDFFSPTMAGIADTVGMSHNVAGVTLLAFANGAPDVFASFSALTGGKEELGIGALYGAAAFITMGVIGLVCMVAHRAKVTRRPVARDMLFLVITIVGIYLVLVTGEIHLYESVMIFGTYIVYVIVVLISRAIYQRMKLNKNPDVKQGINAPLNDPASAETPLVGDGVLYPPPEYSEIKGGANPAQSSYLVNGLDEDSEETAAGRDRLLSDITQEFEEPPKSIGTKVLDFVCMPIYYAARLTIPLIDPGKWDWRLSVAQPTFAPPFFMFAFDIIDVEAGGIPLAPFITFAGAMVSVFLFFKLRVRRENPRYKMIFLGIAFLVGVGWISLIADELVTVLASLGVVLNISQSILGITVLAWGNSVGDAVANVTVAKFGYPQMAIGAALGGPIFNLLIGVGVSMVANNLTTSDPFPVPNNSHVSLSAIFIGSILLVHSMMIIGYKWRISKTQGYIAFSLYALYIALNIMITAEIFDF